MLDMANEHAPENTRSLHVRWQRDQHDLAVTNEGGDVDLVLVLCEHPRRIRINQTGTDKDN